MTQRYTAIAAFDIKRGFSVTAAAAVERRFPRCFAKVRTAEDFLVTGRRHFCCRHIIEGAEAMFCTDHHNLGVRCVGCMGNHIPRHSDEAERTCDECGCVAPGIRAIMCTSFLRLRVQEPRGRRRAYAGLVTFYAVGACSRCGGPE